MCYNIARFQGNPELQLVYKQWRYHGNPENKIEYQKRVNYNTTYSQQATNHQNSTANSPTVSPPTHRRLITDPVTGLQTTHRLPTADHQPTDKSYTDLPTTNTGTTDRPSNDPPTIDLPTTD